MGRDGTGRSVLPLPRVLFHRKVFLSSLASWPPCEGRDARVWARGIPMVAMEVDDPLVSEKIDKSKKWDGLDKNKFEAWHVKIMGAVHEHMCYAALPTRAHIEWATGIFDDAQVSEFLARYTESWVWGL